MMETSLQTQSPVLLDVHDLTTYFHIRSGVVRAVEDMTFSLQSGETLGIVGESGSGKSVSMMSMLGLIPIPPGRIERGTAHFEGHDLIRSNQAELRRIRGQRISMIFQDPLTALNPYMTIGEQVMEPLRLHTDVSRKEIQDRAVEALMHVGIHDAARRLRDYPHQYSGGMRQRVMIAMALITNPALLIADEPTTALDVTVQAQILELIVRLQSEMGMAVILITHDLGVVAGICRRVIVMYAGRIMESAPTDMLFRQPRHPYTKALMASLPSMHTHGDQLYTIPGRPPDLIARCPGCPFAPRCEYATEDCHTTAMALEEIDSGHFSACIRTKRGEI